VDSLRLRRLERSDLPFADSLRALAGWNQTMADWERFLEFDARGCFLAEWEDQPAGVVTTLTYGVELAWIGMALVHPDYRRRGIGHKLLERAVEYLRDRGIQTIKLDATPAGRPTYLKLGFKDESTFTRWEGSSLCPPGRDFHAWELAPIYELDIAAFGVCRARLLTSLARQSQFSLTDGNQGHGMLRRGSRAYYLGPVTAQSDAHGLEIVEALLGRIHGDAVFWDIFDQNATVARWAQDHGFKPQRRLTRMSLGAGSVAVQTQMQIAIAGPELG
jgi:GNAT superfamily N-acetyltransferase